MESYETSSSTEAPRSLRDILKEGKLAPSERIDIFIKTLNLAKEMHAKGLIHGDLNPDHITYDPKSKEVKFTGSMELKIGDLPKDVPDDIGYTSGFMRREGYSAAGPEFDIFSLGRVARELFGFPMFAGHFYRQRQIGAIDHNASKGFRGEARPILSDMIEKMEGEYGQSTSIDKVLQQMEDVRAELQPKKEEAKTPEVSQTQTQQTEGSSSAPSPPVSVLRETLLLEAARSGDIDRVREVLAKPRATSLQWDGDAAYTSAEAPAIKRLILAAQLKFELDKALRNDTDLQFAKSEQFQNLQKLLSAIEGKMPKEDFEKIKLGKIDEKWKKFFDKADSDLGLKIKPESLDDHKKKGAKTAAGSTTNLEEEQKQQQPKDRSGGLREFFNKFSFSLRSGGSRPAKDKPSTKPRDDDQFRPG